MVRQHNLDMRQMALLLHLRLGWQRWEEQKVEWWRVAKEWTKGLRRATLSTEERLQREEIQEDREYWNRGVLAMSQEGERNALEKEEKRVRAMLKCVAKEAKYRTMQQAKEREQRKHMTACRLSGWEGLTRKELKEEEKEARWKLRGGWNQATAKWHQTTDRRAIEMEELTGRRRLEAWHRRLANEANNRRQLKLSQTDIDETRQYLVPMTTNSPVKVSSRRSTQFGSKRRREQPSNGRERSPRPKRRTVRQGTED